MSDPKNWNEYNEKFTSAQEVTGYGVDTTLHMPCPFCCAPDFLVYPIIQAERILAEGAVCSTCKRGCAVEFLPGTPGVRQFEFVQTCGKNPPSFLPPMKRKGS